MKKTRFVLLVCLSLLLCAGVAQAATVGSEYYGTYTGTVSMGGSHTHLTVTIGNDRKQLDLDGSDGAIYLWVSDTSSTWDAAWTRYTDASKTTTREAGSYCASSWTDNSFQYTQVGMTGNTTWTTVISLVFTTRGPELIGFDYDAVKGKQVISGTLSPMQQ